MFAGTRGRQIAGRFTVIPATPFAYGTAEQREQWRALVATMESTLRLHKHQPGSLVALDEYLYRRSGGMIGSLSQLIRGAAILAIEDGSERITRDLLDIVPVDYAAERGHTAPAQPRRSAKRAGGLMLGLSRLPIAVAPARHETARLLPVARLAALHGLHARELWDQVSSRRPGTTGATSPADRLAALTGRPAAAPRPRAARAARSRPGLARRWRHQPQPRCPRCDARHDGGPVTRAAAAPPLRLHPAPVLDRPARCRSARHPARPGNSPDIVSAQRRHLRLVRRYGSAAAYDAVLTGFLICGHLWGDQPQTTRRRRGAGGRRAPRSSSRPAPDPASSAPPDCSPRSIPKPSTSPHSSPRPHWRRLAAGDAEQTAAVHHRDRAAPRPPGLPATRGRRRDRHWMKYDSWRPPSKPHKLFPAHPRIRLNPASHDQLTEQRPAGPQCVLVQHQPARRQVLLHHRHIRPVLIRDWSRPMDGIAATIWASQSTFELRPSEGAMADTSGHSAQNGLHSFA